MTSDLARWRAETPGCAERIHLNNAGASLMPRPVLDAITAHLDQESRLGGYEAADAAAAQIDATYQAVAELIKTAPHNIALVENATVGFAQALSAFDFRPGDVIVTSRADYVSNQLMFLSLGARYGAVGRRAADLPEGGVDPDSVRTMVNDRRPRLVALTWVPTSSGLVQDVAAVGAVCETAGVPYLIDACQALGQLPIDVAALHCDYLSTTARKFLRGPRGIGFLYVSDRALARGDHPLLVDMRGADWTGPDLFQLVDGARRFENWETACALVLGLGAAARYSLQVGAAGSERASTLAAGLRRRLPAGGRSS